MKFSEKRLEVLKLWNTGRYNYAEIGLLLKISRERVRQHIDHSRANGFKVLSREDWLKIQKELRSKHPTRF